MVRSLIQLSADAQCIWWAGVRAVDPARLVPEHVSIDGDLLRVEDEIIDLRTVRRVAIVGAGKASGAMAVALEQVLGPHVLAEKNFIGWVNVPGDCLVHTSRAHLHAARPAGVNEPRSEGVAGTRQILELVTSLGPDDLCFCVLSGGGSALLPAPVPGIKLDDKIRLTQLMSAAGANIEQLNAVRRPLSLVKGGGLARACRAGRLISLILSDVLGDPLEAIASGPTVFGKTSPNEALQVLADLQLVGEPDLAAIVHWLRQTVDREGEAPAEPCTGNAAVLAGASSSQLSHVTNIVIGNNAVAVDAAGWEAERLGYSHAMIAASRAEGLAEEVGEHLAAMAIRMRDKPGPDCLISGGEPTVNLVDPNVRGLGGRNQQLALAALAKLGACNRIALLSGGTDGEDGPTDAAGAVVNAKVVACAEQLGLDTRDYLRRNDAYRFFEATGGLFKTGPTHTNVCDLRVVLTDAPAH